jgi:hypothetical protein
MSQSSSPGLFPAFGSPGYQERCAIPTPFETLVQHNPLLFRVFDASSHSILSQRRCVGFASGSCANMTGDEDVLFCLRWKIFLREDVADQFRKDVTNHLSWGYTGEISDGMLDRRPGTHFVSLSFSLYWAMWEAERRYKRGREDVCIAIVCGTSLDKNAEVALRLLEDIPVCSQNRASLQK